MSKTASKTATPTKHERRENGTIKPVAKGKAKKEGAFSTEFTFDRETKTTYRFMEKGDPDQHIVGTLYVKKSAFGSLKEPPQTITLDAAWS